MNLLLDTHALIWFAENDRQLSAKAKAALEDEANLLYYSIVNIWEMAIKLGLGKLRMAVLLEPVFRERLQDHGLEELPISYAHAAGVTSLPRHHGDPFDRLLVMQARLEKLTLVSHDPVLDRYGIKRLW